MNRNPLIARTLYRSGDIEAYGTGIKRIKDLCDEADLKVEYARVPNGTKLIFHRNDPFAQAAGANAPTNTVPNVTQNDTVNVTLNDTRILTARQAKILSLLEVNPEITGDEIAEKMEIGLRTIRRELKTLQDKGLVEREGSDKTGVWVVNNQTKQ